MVNMDVEPSSPLSAVPSSEVGNPEDVQMEGDNGATANEDRAIRSPSSVKTYVSNPMHGPSSKGFQPEPYVYEDPPRTRKGAKKKKKRSASSDEDDDGSEPDYTPRATTSRTRKVQEENTAKELNKTTGLKAKANLPEAIPHHTGNRARGWNPKTVLTSSKSRLANANLRGMLFDPAAWTSLTHEQQTALIAATPGAGDAIDPSDPESVAAFAQAVLRPNTAFQTDIRLYQEDLAAGRLEPAWARAAGAAMEARAAGAFDATKAAEFEAFWGQKQRTPEHHRAGRAAEVSAAEMVAAALFRVGDVWEWAHSFRASRAAAGRAKGKAGENALVEKEAEIVEITDECQLMFRMAAGPTKFVRQAPSPTDGAGDGDSKPAVASAETEATAAATPDPAGNIVVGPIDHPSALIAAMMKTYGYKQRVSNAWKQIRVRRNNQDIGSPFDIREAYWLRKHGLGGQGPASEK